MDRDRFLRLKVVFRKALNTPPRDRPALLERACGADAALLREVEDLLAHAASAPAGFLDGGPASVAPELVALEIPGFRIVEQIAAGGTGVVYRAEQASPRRDVALKVLRLDSLAPGQVARFRREAEILGSLQHPGIAQVHGAGVLESGSVALPWIAMELVRGVPIDRHVRERALDLRAILALFLDVCEAVEHAHRRGIVHRDLKPAHVLVDAGGRARVVDFGVARGGQAEPGLAPTRTGALLGTLATMAPEQARGDREIDARADVYALGVVLFELLTGRLPIPVDGLELFVALREVCEAAPERLCRARPDLPRDLDAVLAMALEKEPRRRYADAGELAADVARVLALQPVRARRAGALARLAKGVRRNRALALGLGSVGLALAAGLTVALLALAKERSQRERTSETLDFLARRTTARVPKLGLGEDQRAELLEVAERIERQLEVDPGRRALRDALARTLFDLGSLDQVRKDLPAMRARMERARALREELLEADPDDVASSAHLSQVCAKLGEAARDGGDPEGRDAWFARAHSIVETLVRDHPDDLELREDLGWSWARLAQVATDRGDRAEAERLARLRLADAELIARAEPDNWKYVFNLSHAHHVLIFIDPEHAREHALESVALARRLRAIEPDRRDFVAWLSEACRRASRLLAQMGERDAALTCAREALTVAEELVRADPGRPDHLAILVGTAQDLARLGASGEGPEDGEQAAETLRRVAGMLRPSGHAEQADVLASAADEIAGPTRGH